MALLVAVGGVHVPTDVRIESAPIGYVFAFANWGLFVLYIILGHRLFGDGGIDRLSMAIDGP
jgi:inner membrane transporter RhtA